MERLEWHRLPELLNVIKGDMALIGVKPLPPEELAHLTEEWQQGRTACKTGFTGLWYIQTVRSSHLDDVLVADAYYAATRDLRTDLGILRETPGAWFARVKTRECSKRTTVPVLSRGLEGEDSPRTIVS
jgi:lipopolysaccharide/colanic/teichoic acid biosynthesis glycosyltransferase